MATRADVIAGALRELEILSASEAPTAFHEAFVGGILDDAFAETVATQGLTFAWSPATDDIPAAYKRSLVLLTAAEIAPHFMVQGPSRSAAIGRLRALALPDDRADSRDLDEDGTVTEAEEDAAARAAYY